MELDLGKNRRVSDGMGFLKAVPKLELGNKYFNILKTPLPVLLPQGARGLACLIPDFAFKSAMKTQRTS
jgi:hypothetical protein